MRKSKLTPFIPYFILFIFSVLLYGKTASYEFVLDDKMIIENNSLVSGGIEVYKDIFTTNYSFGKNGYNDGLYRPMNLFIFNLQHKLWAFNPIGYHIINIILYGILAILIFRFLILLFGKNRQNLSFIIALLFIAHPIHSEVVANIKSLDEILALLFGISAFIVFILWSEKGKWGHYILGLFLFLLALLSKESILSFLVIIPFTLFYIKKLSVPKSLISFGGLLGLATLWFLWRSYIINSMVNKAGKGSFELLNNTLFGAENYLHQLTNALWLQVLYIKQLIIPHPLVYDYSYNSIPLNPIVSLQTAVALCILALIIFLFIKRFTKNKEFVIGIIFYFTTIFIVSNIMLLIGMTYAERFAFTPSLGFIIAIVFLSAERINNTIIEPTKWAKKNMGFIAIYSIVIIFFCAITISATNDWKSNYTLYKADIKNAKNSAKANYSYGTELMHKSQAENNKVISQEAISYLQKAISIYPNFQDAYNNLAICYSDLGNYKMSLNTFAKLNKKHPEYSKAWYGMGMAYYNLKKYHEAITQLSKYTNKYANENAHYYIGLSYGNIGDFENAINSFNNCINMNPRNIDALLMTARANATLQSHQEVRITLEKLISINPNHTEAEAMMVYTLLNLNRETDALSLISKLEKKYPNDSGIQNLRASLNR